MVSDFLKTDSLLTRFQCKLNQGQLSDIKAIRSEQLTQNLICLMVDDLIFTGWNLK